MLAGIFGSLSPENAFYLLTVGGMAVAWLRSAAKRAGLWKEKYAVWEKIITELSPNGGKSMKDQIQQCLAGVAECKDANAHEKSELAALREEMAEQTKKLDAILKTHVD